MDIRRIYNDSSSRQAHALLREEFPDHAATDIEYFYWDHMLAITEDEDVVGLITIQRYLPGKAILADIVVSKKYRSKGVAIKLLNMICLELLGRGYTHIIGITEKTDRAALNTYKRCAGKQRECIVTTGELKESTARMGHILSSLKLRKYK